MMSDLNHLICMNIAKCQGCPDLTFLVASHIIKIAIGMIVGVSLMHAT